MNENKNDPNKKSEPFEKIFKDLQANENNTIKYKNLNDSNSKKKRIVKIIVALLVFFSLLITWRVYSFLKKFQYEKIDQSDIGINEEMFKGELNNIVNIALLGVDANGTSDAILIVSLNPQADNPTIKLISIARDSLAEIFPKNKKSYFTKITEAYSDGKEETILRSLNKNFNLNVKNFISIENQGFATIVDKLGGIDLTITEDEKNQINGIMRTNTKLKKTDIQYLQDYGEVHLSGVQAAAFVRIRKKPTKTGKQDDFGRGDRQKEVLRKIFEKIKTTSKRQIISMVEPCLQYLKTSFKISGIFKLCKDILARKYTIKETSIPALNTPIDMDYTIFRGDTAKSTVLYDLEYAGKIIHAFIYDDIAPNDFILKNPPPSLRVTKQKINKNDFSLKHNSFHKIKPETEKKSNISTTMEKKDNIKKETTPNEQNNNNKQTKKNNEITSKNPFSSPHHIEKNNKDNKLNSKQNQTKNNNNNTKNTNLNNQNSKQNQAKLQNKNQKNNPKIKPAS